MQKASAAGIPLGPSGEPGTNAKGIPLGDKIMFHDVHS